MPADSFSSKQDPIQILMVDDDVDQLEISRISLEDTDSNLKVTGVTTPEEAIKLLEENRFDCVVSDYQMPGMNGIMLADKTRETSDIPFIIYTGKGSEEVAEAAFAAGVDDYARKEQGLAHFKVLTKRIRSHIDHHRSRLRSQLHYERIEALHINATRLARSESVEEVAEVTFNTLSRVLGFEGGGFAIVEDGKLTEEQVLEPKKAVCVFEWVYFSRPDSVVEGKTVHNARKRFGHGLVDLHDLNKEYAKDKGNGLVVIPVPDSGRSVSTGTAEALGVTADEGVIKNAYMGRTYLIDDPDYRKVASDLKHNIIKETVAGKKVVLADDSIVRGTVSESIAKNLRQAGATEVDFLVSYAPIFYPCFSDPLDKPLAAKAFKGKSPEEIGDLVAGNLPSIDNVRYNSEEKILEAVGLPPEHICTYCISGRDPFKE